MIKTEEIWELMMLIYVGLVPPPDKNNVYKLLPKEIPHYGSAKTGFNR
jgi:hypothetical protein